MTSRRTRFLPALVGLMLALAGCAGAPEPATTEASARGYPVEATTCGFTSTVSAAPERAVAMNQGATEVLLALGLEDRMAGTAYLDDAVPEKWQQAYESVPVLAEAYPDHETVLAVEPDFVYASYPSAFDPAAAGPQEDLEKLGIGSLLSPFGCGATGPGTQPSFESIWEEIFLVGEVFGVPERAEEVNAAQQRELDRLAKAAPGKGITVFWFDSGDKTALAGAGQGGPQLVLDAVGATNVFGHLDGGWAEVSWEKVVEADPDAIVLADASWSRAEDKRAMLERDPVLRHLGAVREGAYAVLPFAETTPGVRLADGAVSLGEQLAELH